MGSSGEFRSDEKEKINVRDRKLCDGDSRNRDFAAGAVIGIVMTLSCKPGKFL